MSLWHRFQRAWPMTRNGAPLSQQTDCYKIVVAAPDSSGLHGGIQVTVVKAKEGMTPFPPSFGVRRHYHPKDAIRLILFRDSGSSGCSELIQSTRQCLCPVYCSLRPLSNRRGRYSFRSCAATSGPSGSNMHLSHQTGSASGCSCTPDHPIRCSDVATLRMRCREQPRYATRYPSQHVELSPLIHPPTQQHPTTPPGLSNLTRRPRIRGGCATSGDLRARATRRRRLPYLV